MSTLDWVIVALTVVLALYGYAQGFLVGALSLAGFAAGAVFGTRVGPLLLPAGSHSPYAPVFGLLGALLAGGVLATGLEGLGMRARAVLRIPGLRTVDGLLGALLTACVGLGVAWIAGSIALETSGSLALQRDIQRSAILRVLNEVLPPSGPILHALARLDPLPSVRGPEADVPPPSAGILGAPRMRATERSVVRIVGSACGLGIEGSGWVVAPGLVITNAHVVAGEHDTLVQVGGVPPGLPAQALVFDPHNDVAVLRVPGLHEPAVPMFVGNPAALPAAILGYPEDGPFDARPARVGQTETVNTQDAYGNGNVQRTITTLRGLVRPGNSGGPLVGADGRVLATVFAAIVGTSQRGGFAVPDAIVARELARARAAARAVATGPCAS